MSGWGPRVLPATGGGGGGGGGIGNPDLPEEVLSIYDEANAVLANVDATIISYTIVGSNPTHLIRAEFGGTNIGRYYLKIDGVVQAQFVTWFNGPMDGSWDFSANSQGLPLNPGQIITIKVSHGRPFSGDYWAKLTLIKVDV